MLKIVPVNKGIRLKNSKEIEVMIGKQELFVKKPNIKKLRNWHKNKQNIKNRIFSTISRIGFSY